MHYTRNQPADDTKGLVAAGNCQPLMSWRISTGRGDHVGHTLYAAQFTLGPGLPQSPCATANGGDSPGASERGAKVYGTWQRRGVDLDGCDQGWGNSPQLQHHPPCLPAPTVGAGQARA